MRTAVAASLCVLVLGCSSSKPTSAVSLLSEETVTSRDGRLAGRIPLGWFSAAEESLAAAAELWLVRDDLGAGIAVTELQLDAAATRLVRERGPGALASASRSLRGLPPVPDGTPCREIGENGTCGYVVTDAAGTPRSRVLVFTRGERFYECELLFLGGANPAAAAPALEEAYRLQEAFVEALKAPATSS